MITHEVKLSHELAVAIGWDIKDLHIVNLRDQTKKQVVVADTKDTCRGRTANEQCL